AVVRLSEEMEFDGTFGTAAPAIGSTCMAEWEGTSLDRTGGIWTSSALCEHSCTWFFDHINSHGAAVGFEPEVTPDGIVLAADRAGIPDRRDTCVALPDRTTKDCMHLRP